jgi:hypothetical protein
MENRISIIITDAQKADILDKIQNVDGSMPWLITLDKDEVLGELRLDKESILYLDETIGILERVGDLISPEKKDEFIKDVNFYRAMLPVVLAQQTLSNKITKTMIRCGQEVNAVFREVYTTLQVKAKHDSSYQVYLDKLTPYFKKFGKKKGSTPK